MTARLHFFIFTLLYCLAFISPARAVEPLWHWWPLKQVSHAEKLETHPSVMNLGHSLDCLENRLATHGVVTAQQASVWGEARLTRHRQEYEQMMKERLNKFDLVYSAAISRSDQAFLGAALALQAAATDGVEIPAANTVTDTGGVESLISDPADPNSDVIVRTDPFASTPKDTKILGFGFSKEQVSLEPTVYLDQMSRYLNHLHELRRINEGDDTADSPGYSLSLVRIPVSVIPGKKTRKGHGAEITITADPYLGPELLPMTFRSLVINDLMDVLCVPLIDIEFSTRQRNSKIEQAAESNKALKNRLKLSPQWMHTPETANQIYRDFRPQVNEGLDDQSKARPPQTPWLSFQGAGLRRGRMPVPQSQLLGVFDENFLVAIADAYRRPVPTGLADFLGDSPEYRVGEEEPAQVLDMHKWLREELEAAYELLSIGARGESIEIVDDEQTAAPVELPQDWESFAQHVDSPALLHHFLWRTNYLLVVADAIRTNNAGLLERCRNELECLLHDANLGKPLSEATPRLAWGICVESSLLNQRLMDDMQMLAGNKGCLCMTQPVSIFAGPNPSQEARMAFAEYVRCRWPVIVFALDPATDDQNVADAYARRRELQLAVSLAFASGQIRMQQLTRFARRIEADMMTLSLNRTVSGFSHSNDTFGWRFYPRFQTPPVRGTLATFSETLFGGPTTDADMRQRQLEPGIRECTAIVLAPSFVPYVTFDTRANWFKLTNPRQIEYSMTDTLEMSRSVKVMLDSPQFISDASMYRDGDLDLLLRRAHQLSRKLPIQTMSVQMPVENTLGGFEMLSTGSHQLAPELIGWYGEPGIATDKPTTLFLVGDNFSVHETRVIVGNTSVEPILLSRQIMMVTIPPGVRPTVPPNASNPEPGRVDVHIATPYGVTGHLQLPIIAPSSSATPPKLTYTWDADAYKATVAIALKPKDGEKPREIDTTKTLVLLDPPPQIAIRFPSLGVPGSVKLQLILIDNKKLAVPVETSFEVTARFDAGTRTYVVATDQLAVLLGKIRDHFNRQPVASLITGSKKTLELQGAVHDAGASQMLVPQQIEGSTKIEIVLQVSG